LGFDGLSTATQVLRSTPEITGSPCVILFHPSAGAAIGGMEVYLEKTLLGSYFAGAGSTLRSLTRLLMNELTSLRAAA